MEAGSIPFERPAAGRHRRVRLQDVIDYQHTQRTNRRADLDAITADAAGAGLYDTVPDYTQALADARRRLTTRR